MRNPMYEILGFEECNLIARQFYVLYYRQNVRGHNSIYFLLMIETQFIDKNSVFLYTTLCGLIQPRLRIFYIVRP